MVPEFFALVHVGDVNLDGGKLDGGKGVPEGHGSVGEGAGVDDDACGVVPGCVDDVEQDAFVVGQAGWWSGARSVRAASCSTSANVEVPYFSGSRVPSRFRFGPLITRMVRPAAESVEASVMDANLSAGARVPRILTQCAAPYRLVPTGPLASQARPGNPAGVGPRVLKRESDVYGAIGGR